MLIGLLDLNVKLTVTIPLGGTPKETAEAEFTPEAVADLSKSLVKQLRDGLGSAGEVKLAECSIKFEEL